MPLPFTALELQPIYMVKHGKAKDGDRQTDLCKFLGGLVYTGLCFSQRGLHCEILS